MVEWSLASCPLLGERSASIRVADAAGSRGRDRRARAISRSSTAVARRTTSRGATADTATPLRVGTPTFTWPDRDPTALHDDVDRAGPWWSRWPGGARPRTSGQAHRVETVDVAHHPVDDEPDAAEVDENIWPTMSPITAASARPPPSTSRTSPRSTRSTDFSAIRMSPGLVHTVTAEPRIPEPPEPAHPGPDDADRATAVRDLRRRERASGATTAGSDHPPRRG